jgi:hypothetical protein
MFHFYLVKEISKAPILNSIIAIAAKNPQILAFAICTQIYFTIFLYLYMCDASSCFTRYSSLSLVDKKRCHPRDRV